MKRRVSFAIVIAVVAALAGSASAATPPPTLPGWPRSVPAGTLLQGPGGGVVVAAIEDDFRYLVSAYRRDGRRIWASARTAACGNCDDGPQPVALQPDGTYGPIGSEADDFWAIDARGRRVPGCAGVVFPDSTCITATSFDVPSWVTPRPGFQATRTSAPWSVFSLAYRWGPDTLRMPPMTVRDGAGLVYAAFPSPAPDWAPVSEPALSGVMMAVDPASHAIAWTHVGPREALAGLPSGALVADPGRIISIGPDARERWSRPFQTTPADVVVDAARDRVYVGSAVGEGDLRVVRALSLSTGATVWRTRSADRARLMSVGRGGRVYVAVSTPGHEAVRGLRVATGAAVWQQASRRPVRGVVELINGTVAISSGADIDGTLAGGRLTIVDPR